MRLNNKFIQIALAIFFTGSCQNVKKNELTPGTEKAEEVSEFFIDPGSTHQTIDNFGASDAWSCQFVGEWPVEKRKEIAGLLFSKDLDQNQNPEGIGLSLWRFNLGAGSASQGDQSGIKDEWRRAESFLQRDGSYNWENQKGQVWFAKEAKERAVENILVFANSPSVNFTRNGKAYSGSKEQSNLPRENYGDFAVYLAKAAEGLEKMGIPVDIISPVNEPQWDWTDGGQEGTPFWNNEIAEIVRLLDKEIDHRNLNAKIDIAEAAQINYLYEQGNRPGRGAQISSFFIEDSENYIGDLTHVSPTISGHSYFTTSPEATLLGHREKLAQHLSEQPDIKYWMSEYCILGDNEGEINGNKRDLGMPPALYMAKVIHTDLVVSGASAWHWWVAISPYDYKDGLIYIDKNKTDGNYYPSKMLWALGNYSRFIRPGYKRIDVKGKSGSASEQLLLSGYVHPEKEEVVLVAVNVGTEDIRTKFNLSDTVMGAVSTYVTSATRDLEKIDLQEGSNFIIPKESIVTLVYRP